MKNVAIKILQNAKDGINQDQKRNDWIDANPNHFLVWIGLKQKIKINLLAEQQIEKAIMHLRSEFMCSPPSWWKIDGYLFYCESVGIEEETYFGYGFFDGEWMGLGEFDFGSDPEIQKSSMDEVSDALVNEAKKITSHLDWSAVDTSIEGWFRGEVIIREDHLALSIYHPSDKWPFTLFMNGVWTNPPKDRAKGIDTDIQNTRKPRV